MTEKEAFIQLQQRLCAQGFENLSHMEDLKKYFKPLEFKRGQQFLDQDDTESRIAYIAKGLFRYYYLTPKGDDITKHFSTEGDFVSSYASLIYQRPSAYGIVAEEDATILVIDKDTYLGLLESGGPWERIARHYTEHIYNLKELREASLLLLDAKARYIDFCLRYPYLKDRVKQKHLATFLGLHPVTLSKLRKDVKLTQD